MENQNGLSLQELLDIKNENPKQFFRFLDFSDQEYADYCALLDSLTRIHLDRHSTPRQKGRSLEDISRFLLAHPTDTFDTLRNIRTSTNEIDILVKKCLSYTFVDQDNFLGSYFICECKNYSKKIGVTHIGKLFSVMEIAGTKFAILFSYHGLTGSFSSWNNSHGLIKKLNLMTRKLPTNEIIIVNVNISDFQRIARDRLSFWNILHSKIIELRLGTNIEFPNRLTQQERESIRSQLPY